MSIHQPNVEVLDKFDWLYVLSRGGVNVYSGRPQHLRQHMKRCDIECNDKEIAIEQLLKICVNDCNHISIMRMSNEIQTFVNFNVEPINMSLTRNRMTRFSKTFSLKELLYLLKRNIIIFIRRFLLVHVFIIILMSIFIYVVGEFSQHVSQEVKDCKLDNDTNHCTNIIDEIADKQVSRYNVQNLTMMNNFFWFYILFWSFNFSNDIKTFLMENRNSKLQQVDYWLNYILLSLSRKNSPP